MSSQYSRVKTSIALDWELLKRLKAEAERQRRPVSQLVEFAVEVLLTELEREPAPPPEYHPAQT